MMNGTCICWCCLNVTSYSLLSVLISGAEHHESAIIRTHTSDKKAKNTYRMRLARHQFLPLNTFDDGIRNLDSGCAAT